MRRTDERPVTDAAIPTKILFVIGTLAVGGSETQLMELASRLDRRRFEPVVCSLFSGGDLVAPLRARGVRVHELDFDALPVGRLWFLTGLPAIARALWQLWRLIRRERPAILHGVLLWAYVLGTFLGRAAGVPVIIASRRSLGLFKADKPHYLFLERMGNRLTDLVIANSEAVREDTLQRENVRREDIVVIHNGLDLARFDAAPDERLAAGLELGRGPRVIVVSNLIYYKGHEHFFRAWAGVVGRFPNAVAMLVGDGLQRPALDVLAEELGIRSSLRFLGVRHDVPGLLALADVYVHPSLQEGFSNAVLEAMGAGKAIVATRVGGNAEAIVDGETGILVPPADPDALRRGILRLLEDPDHARQMGARARDRVRARHDIEVVVQQYEREYERMLAARTRTKRGA